MNMHKKSVRPFPFWLGCWLSQPEAPTPIALQKILLDKYVYTR